MLLLTEVTLRDAGEVTIWLGAVCAALVTIGGALHLALLRPLRNWIRDELSELSTKQQETADKLETENDQTVGQYVEGSATTLREIRQQLARTNERALQTNQLSLQAHRLALRNQELLLEQARRLNEHLQDHLHHEGG